MASSGALDDVGGPGAVVETVAAVGALHTTVAAEEVAAHAEGEAVGVVLAEELVGRDGGEQSHCRAVPVVVHQALGLFQVSEVRQPELGRFLVILSKLYFVSGIPTCLDCWG